MEYHNSIYILLIISSVYFASLAAKTVSKSKKKIWTTMPFYILLILFSYIVGTRYMVGMDYEQYLSIVELGENHYYYESMETLCRFFIDIVNDFNLKFYWWFILMSFVQIFFIAIAVKDNLKKAFPWIILCFFMLYISFYMNAIRQGAALSCFIYAVSFIKDRKLYYYLAFIFIGSLFHRSIIFWLPTYWFLNKEIFYSIKTQYIILCSSVLLLPILMSKIIQMLMPIIGLIGYEGQANTLVNKSEVDIVMGSGLGILFRYIRWITIISFYNKLKSFIGENIFIPLYNLFFIGVILDAATMDIIILNRIVIYGGIFEIYILGLLFYYATKSKNILEKIIIFTILLLQIILSFFPLFTGTFKWFTIWDAPLVI